MLSITQPHHYYQTFLAQGIGMGLASGILFLPFLSVTSHYFRRRRTVAMGIVLAGSSLGAVIYPIMLNNLFNSVGYAWAVRASGFLDMGFLILANLMMKTRLPNRRQMPNRKPVDVKGILTDVGYWLSVIGAGCVFWGLFVPFFYLQLFAELHGLSSTLSFYSIPILNASSMFGRTIPNLLADIWGPFNIIIPCVIIAGGLVFLMFVTSSVGGMIAFGILYGFFSGAFMSLMSPVAASFCRDLNEIGFRIGLASFAVAFTLLTGTPIAGALVQENGTYVWYRPLVFATVTVLAGAAFLVVSRHMLSKRRGSQIV
ncbi:major facilitator superfamily domain-containing protein [Suillus lakei]|nr:major facilitator superfamily domain-containing protein [Suillus lakei]